MKEKLVLSVLVDNESGVLQRVASLFSRRSYNISSLTVSETEDEKFSRMTIETETEPENVRQIKAQLLKLEIVKKVSELKPDSSVSSELLLVKVHAQGIEHKNALLAFNARWGARVLDVSMTTITFEFTGLGSTIDMFVEELENELKILLLPKDPNDDKDIVVEIRAGAGGEEAALFAAELFRMYSHYADTKGWKIEVVNADETGIGGMKEVEFMVKGQGAYSVMKYESGVHRVQRIPVTESNGRIQTSTASVAVMPEAEEVDIHIDEKDIRIDVMRASGNGGQCVNTTDSAVRLTHYPTGIVIYSQTEKSQIQNKEKAFALLRAKLYDIETQKAHDAEADARRSQIGTGDRAEKIRTYNFPQGRVTDHRIKLTLHKLDSILNGDLDEVIDSLIAADQTAKLAKMEE